MYPSYDHPLLPPFEILDLWRCQADDTNSDRLILVLCQGVFGKGVDQKRSHLWSVGASHRADVMLVGAPQQKNAPPSLSYQHKTQIGHLMFRSCGAKVEWDRVYITDLHASSCWDGLDMFDGVPEGEIGWFHGISGKLVGLTVSKQHAKIFRLAHALVVEGVLLPITDASDGTSNDPFMKMIIYACKLYSIPIRHLPVQIAGELPAMLLLETNLCRSKRFPTSLSDHLLDSSRLNHTGNLFPPPRSQGSLNALIGGLNARP